jgi:hypothetical protein
METIKQKVAHVKRAGQTRNHSCHWPGCPQQVPPALWGCKRHWFMLPKPIRNKIWQEYRSGQEETFDPSKEYISAAIEAQNWIRENAS